MTRNTAFTIINRKDRQILRDLLPLAKPLSVFIEPTNMCNFRCVCCGHGQKNTRNDLKPLIHMDLGLFRKLVNELKTWPGDRLRLLRLAVLGEPLLHPQFLDMIRISKDAGIAERVDTFSNGSLLTKEIAMKLVDCGLDGIRFSIYSVLPERHRQVTQTNFDLYKIHRNIQMLRETRERMGSSKPSIFVKMFDTYGEENDLFIDMYKDIADELGFEKVNDATKYNGTNLIGSFYKDPQQEETTRKTFQESLNEHIACPRPFMALVINSVGSVLMCTHDYPKATRIGDVNHETLRQIWNGKELFEFRKMHLQGNKHQNLLCRNCDWYKLFPAEDNVDGFPIEKLVSQRS